MKKIRKIVRKVLDLTNKNFLLSERKRLSEGEGNLYDYQELIFDSDISDSHKNRKSKSKKSLNFFSKVFSKKSRTIFKFFIRYFKPKKI